MLRNTLHSKLKEIKEAIVHTPASEFIILTLAFLIPILAFPTLRGADAFHLIWMARAIEEGVLWSQDTWLINLFSYFGFFPYSHYPIGVPLILSIPLFFGFSLSVSVLIFDILFVFLLWIGVKKLSEELFEKEWQKNLLITCFLFSPKVFNEIQMTISARLVLTISIVFLLLYIIRFLKSRENKWITYAILIILLATFTHRLWVVLLIFFLALTLILLSSFRRVNIVITVSLIPTYLFSYFFGLFFFSVDPGKISSPWFSNSDLFGVSINLIIDYGLNVGLILIFMPIGVVFSFLMLIYSFKLIPDFSMEKNSYWWNSLLIRSFRIIELPSPDYRNTQVFFLLLLLLVPFTFFLPSFYCIVVFMPVLIIFSVKGFVFVVDILKLNYKHSVGFLPMILWFLSLVYAISYSFLFSVELPLSFLLIIMILFIILIKKIGMSPIKANNPVIKRFFTRITKDNIRKNLQLFVILVSLISFTIVTIEGRNALIKKSENPWKYSFLTDEESIIIEEIRSKGVSGYLLSFSTTISVRISATGFIPVMNPMLTAETLYHNLITREEIIHNLEFNLEDIFIRLTPFTCLRCHEYRKNLNDIIISLDLRKSEDFEEILSHSVQYIVTARDGDSFLPYPYYIEDRNKTRKFSQLFYTIHHRLNPILYTQHLILWKLY